jgi:uncharacterized protein YndB with AHSA1/START domain
LNIVKNYLREINQDLPQAEWVVTFTDKDDHALVETIVTYDSLADLETVIQMGMKEGMIATFEKMDELLENLHT